MQSLLEQGRLDAVASATATEVRVTTAGTIGAVDVFKAWNALPERWRSRASWLMSVSVESQIRSFSSANQSSSFFTVERACVSAAWHHRAHGRRRRAAPDLP
jgi:hypothetical protein